MLIKKRMVKNYLAILKLTFLFLALLGCSLETGKPEAAFLLLFT